MLPSLTALNKSFQFGAIQVSRIVLNFLKTKAELWELFHNGKTDNLLKDDLQTRLLKFANKSRERKNNYR